MCGDLKKKFSTIQDNVLLTNTVLSLSRGKAQGFKFLKLSGNIALKRSYFVTILTKCYSRLDYFFKKTLLTYYRLFSISMNLDLFTLSI